MNNAEDKPDFAGLLEKRFATLQTADPPRWKMSPRNKRRLERIRAAVRRLRERQ